MRYTQARDGDWIRPRRRGYRIACCDCGLVHRFDFRMRKGVLEFRAFRDKRATYRRRKRLGLVVDRVDIVKEVPCSST